MAWSWNHTQEAYVAARENLAEFPRRKLEIIFAEWRAAQVNGVVKDSEAFNQRRYDRGLAKAKKLPDDVLADQIWDWASAAAICTNGGHQAYMCPSGCLCHLVSFSQPEDSNEDE